VWGMVALLAMTWRAKTQLLVGLALYALGTIGMGGAMGAQYYFATDATARATLSEENQQEIMQAEAEELDGVTQDMELFQDGSYLEFVHHQIFEMTEMNITGQVFGLVETLPMILIGMALYRFGFFSGRFDPQAMRRWGWIGIIGGAAVSLASGLVVYRAGFPYFLNFAIFQGSMMLPRLAFVMGLAALLVVWTPRAIQSWLGQRLVAAGRMAFSNYLGTSIIMLFVFHGWALGLYGKLHRIELFGVVLLAWVAMLLWSKPWLERFRFGPLEWLWRCLTYGQLFALRR